MKKNLMIILLALPLLMMSSCSDDVTITSAYGYGIHQFNSNNSNDLSKITNYLQQNNCPLGTEYFTGKSDAENDKQAKEKFDNVVRNLNFTTLGLASGTTFTYSAVASTSTPGEVGRVIASISYP